MKFLTLIRHAKSSWDDAALTDHDRPLNHRGLRAAPIVGRFLANTYLGAGDAPPLLPPPDRVLSSTACRAKHTAELIVAELKSAGPELDRRLYLADPKSMLQIVRAFEDRWRHTMVIGHNPGISE